MHRVTLRKMFRNMNANSEVNSFLKNSNLEYSRIVLFEHDSKSAISNRGNNFTYQFLLQKLLKPDLT